MVNDNNNESISVSNSKYVEGEKNVISRLMLLDDMSCLADKSLPFANFITRTRILGFCVVTIFHDMNSTTGVWS